MSTATHFEVDKSTDNVNFVPVSIAAGTNYTYENSPNSGIIQYFKVRASILGIPQTNLPMHSAFTAVSNITCTYTATNEDQGFEIVKSTNGGGSYSLATRTEANATVGLVNNVTQGVEHLIKVRAVRDYPPQAALPMQSAYTAAQSITCNLSATELQLAEVYYVTLYNGTILTFTSHNADITWGGDTYAAIPIKRNEIKSFSNLQIDNTTITMASIDTMISGYTIPELVAMEWFRRAEVEIYLVNWPTVTFNRLLFKGMVSGRISYDQGALTIECSSELEKLNVNFPKKVYTELCQHEHFSTGTYDCNLTKASYLQTGIVTSSNSKYVLGATRFLFATHASGYWLHGEITFTSGDNNGVTRSIKTHTDGFIAVRAAFPYLIQVGDTFNVYPGCDRLGLTCATKYNNYANFFGFEDIPKTETLYGG